MTVEIPPHLPPKKRNDASETPVSPLTVELPPHYPPKKRK